MASKRQHQHRSISIGQCQPTGSSADANASVNPQLKRLLEILRQCQLSPAAHANGIKELQAIHNAVANSEMFAQWLIDGIKVWLKATMDNKYANGGLEFVVKFLIILNANDNDDAQTHPVLMACFDFLLDITSKKPAVRERIFKLLNALMDHLNREHRSIENDLRDDIEKLVLNRLQYESVAKVREQIIRVVRHFQNATNPHCPITTVYCYHLENDPASRVRMAVLSIIARESPLLPAIIGRLYDSDEKVRKHCVLQLCDWPFEQFSIEQLVQVAHQVFADRSTLVQRAVTKYLLPNWLAIFNNEYVQFLRKFNLNDDTQTSKQSFFNLAKNMLKASFRNPKININALIDQLPITRAASDNGSGGQLIPIDRVRLENVTYWCVLIDHVKNTDTISDRLEEIICDLTSFCAYVRSFIEYDKDYKYSDFEQIICVLLEIIETFDLGDNFGRENLNELLHFALQSRFGYDQIYEKTIRLWEHLLPDENARMKFIADIVREQTSEKRYLVDWERSEIRSFIVCIQSPEAFYHINQLAMHIRKLHNDYRIECDIGMHTNAENKYKMLLQKDGELIALLKRVAKSPAQIRNAEPSTLEFVNKLTAKTGIDYDVVAQSLQKCYYVICSPNTTNINAPMLSLYKDIICRQNGSKNTVVRYWALKCSIAYALTYQQMAEEVYQVLTKQFIEHQHFYIWSLAVTGICELFALYKIDTFNRNVPESCRLEQKQEPPLEANEPAGATAVANSVTMNFLKEMYNSAVDPGIRESLNVGWCHLILSGQHNTMMVSQILLEYFCTPLLQTDAARMKLNQVLGIFLRTLVGRGKQGCLQMALVNTLFILVHAGPGRYRFLPDRIVKFVLQATEPLDLDSNLNLHHRVADTCIDTIEQNGEDAALCQLLAAVLPQLKIGQSRPVRDDIKKRINALLQTPSTINDKVFKLLNKFLHKFDVMRPSRRLSRATSTSSTVSLANTDVASVDGDVIESDTGSIDPSFAANQESEDEVDIDAMITSLGAIVGSTPDANQMSRSFAAQNQRTPASHRRYTSMPNSLPDIE